MPSWISWGSAIHYPHYGIQADTAAAIHGVASRCNKGKKNSGVVFSGNSVLSALESQKGICKKGGGKDKLCEP